MNIEIDSELIDTLNRLAEANSTTPEVYATNVVDAHLKSAFRLSLENKLESRTFSEIKEIESSVSVMIAAQDTQREPEKPIDPVMYPPVVEGQVI